MDGVDTAGPYLAGDGADGDDDDDDGDEKGLISAPVPFFISFREPPGQTITAHAIAVNVQTESEVSRCET